MNECDTKLNTKMYFGNKSHSFEGFKQKQFIKGDIKMTICYSCQFVSLFLTSSTSKSPLAIVFRFTTLTPGYLKKATCRGTRSGPLFALSLAWHQAAKVRTRVNLKFLLNYVVVVSVL